MKYTELALNSVNWESNYPLHITSITSSGRRTPHSFTHKVQNSKMALLIVSHASTQWSSTAEKAQPTPWRQKPTQLFLRSQWKSDDTKCKFTTRSTSRAPCSEGRGSTAQPASTALPPVTVTPICCLTLRKTKNFILLGLFALFSLTVGGKSKTRSWRRRRWHLTAPHSPKAPSRGTPSALTSP